jgi:hypothetical protein
MGAGANNSKQREQRRKPKTFSLIGGWVPVVWLLVNSGREPKECAIWGLCSPWVALLSDIKPQQKDHRIGDINVSFRVP